MKKATGIIYSIILASAPQFALAQQVSSVNFPLVLDAAPVVGSSVSSSPAKASPAKGWATFDRWVDLSEFSVSSRYRNVADSNGVHEFDQGQQRSVVAGKFKFDQAGKYGVVFHGSSGRYFNWSYADYIGGGNKQAIAEENAGGTVIQKSVLGLFLTTYASDVNHFGQSGGWSFYMRRLYLDLEPVSGVELQYGSLDINRGAASEITTYDADGYIAGERLLFKSPKKLFFDEASITYAYLGDIYTPNFFARGNSLAHSNYHQFLLRKKVASRVDSSFDYTWQNSANIFHEAVVVKVPESRVLDSARVETYQRPTTIWFPNTKYLGEAGFTGGNGYALTFDKKIKRLSLEAGDANIDIRSVVLTQHFLSAIFGLGLNGDQYGLGKHYFGRATYQLTPFLEASAFYTHAYGTISDPVQIIWNKQAINGGLTLDLKKALFPQAAAK